MPEKPVTVNALWAVPPSVVATTFVAANAAEIGTVNVADVALAPAATVAATPPMVNVALVKFVPVTVTEEPRAPELVLNEVIVGVG